MRHIVQAAGLLFAAVALSACASLPPTTEFQATALATSPSLAEAAACPSTGTPVLPDLADGMLPADAVSSFLDAGGDPAALAAAIFDRGWESSLSTAVWTDIDGDGNLDFAAGLNGAPDGVDSLTDGGVYLWRCVDGAYLRSEIAPRRPEYGPPAIRQARDLTADGLPELLVAHPLCGAHTCFAQYAVLQWDGAGMVNRFLGTTDDMPTPELAVEADDPQAPATIEITATGIGSVGAGPYRVWSRTWTWNSDANTFVPGEPVVEPPRFRIHAVHDAEDAFRRGDLATALALYQRVIDDDGLLDWPATGDRRQELAAFAAFRRVQAFLTAADTMNAQDELDRWPAGAGASAQAYAELARRLLVASTAVGPERACADVSDFAKENLDLLLAPLDFGYSNRTYAAEDICPMSGS